MTTNEMVRQILTLPDYKGQIHIGISTIANMHFNGNHDKARCFLNKYSVPYYLQDCGYGKNGRGHKMYNIFEVQEAIAKTRWKE